MPLAFGDFEVDEQLCELRCRGEPVAIEPRVFDLLLFLLRHRQRVVPRAELLTAVWPQVAVSESSITTSMNTLRRVLGVPRGEEGPIKTIRGRGYRFVDAVELRDAASPEPAASVPEQAPTRRRPVPSGGESFVGREDALETLHAALARAGEGAGQIVLIAGDAGIGKTRTAEQIAASAREKGARVAEVRCPETRLQPAFHPWLQALRQLATDLPESTAEPIHEVLRSWQAERASESPAAAGPALLQRFRVLDTLVRFQLEIAREQLLLVAIDDIQWADAASLELLAYLASEIRRARILIVATLRDPAANADPMLPRTLAELARHERCERIELGGFSESEVVRFLGLAIGETPSPELARALHRRTDGNPLFLREIVRWLARRGDLDAALAPAARLELPPSLKEVILGRIAQLREECRAVLATAAAVGREFELRPLAEAMGGNRDAVLAALDDAVRARVVEAIGESVTRYRFAHALVFESLYDSLAPGERAALHERVGLAIERLAGDQPGSYLAELSRHFEAAVARGHDAKALDYATRAARRARERGAPDEAAVLYERSLRVLELGSPAPEQHLELLLALGAAQLYSGDPEGTKSVFARAAGLARELRLPGRFVEAALGYGGSVMWGRQPEQLEEALIDEALAMLGAGAPPERARLIARLAAMRANTAPLELLLEASREALELAREVGDSETLLEALRARHHVLHGPDFLPERERLAGEILAVAAETRRPDHAFAVRELRAAEQLSLGDAAGFRASLGDAERTARDLGHPAFLWIAGMSRSSANILEGRFEDAERAIRSSAEHGRRARIPQTGPAALAQMVALRREQGRLAEVGAALESVVDRLDWIGAYPRVLLLVLYVELGERERMRQQFEDIAREDFRDLRRGSDWLICVAELAGACAALGDRARADLLLDLLAPYEARYAVFPGPMISSGPVARFVGLLELLRGDRAAAVRHLERALRQCDALGARPAKVRSLRDLGMALVDGGSNTERRRGRSLLEQAERSARELGMSAPTPRGEALS